MTGVIAACIILGLIYTVLLVLIVSSISASSGRKSSDREVLRRVLISDHLNNDVKVEILNIVNDSIYWKYYEEKETLE